MQIILSLFTPINYILLGFFFLLFCGFIFYLYKQIKKSITPLEFFNLEYDKTLKQYESEQLPDNREIVKKCESIIRSNKKLNDLMKHYFDSIIEAKDNIYATHHIEDYICYDNVFRPNRLIDEVSGIFTAIGLLITFSLIAYGLSELNITSTDSTKIVSGVSALIGTLASKFISSILGIFSAILYTLIKPSLLNKIEEEIELFNSNINKVFKYKYSENTLYDIKTATEEQTENLKEFFSGNDFSDAISRAINNINEQKVMPVLNEIKDILSKSSASEITTAMQTFIQNITTKMEEMSQYQTNGLYEIMSKGQQELRSFVEGLSEKIIVITGEVNKDLKEKFEQSHNQIEQNMNNVLTNMSDNADKVLNKFNQQLDVMGKNLINTQTEVMSSLEKNNASNQENISTLHKQTLEVVSDLKDYIGDVSTSNNKLQEMSNNIIQKYNESIQFNETQLEKTSTVIGNMIACVDNLKEISKLVTNGMQSMNNTSDLLHQVNQALIKHSDTLNNGTKTLFSTLTEKLKVWEEHINNSKITQEKVHHLIGALNSAIDIYVNKFDARNTEFLKSLATETNNVVAAIKSAASSIEDYSEFMTNKINSENKY
jgi:hypothetical protein